MVWVVFKQSQPKLQDQWLLITCETNRLRVPQGSSVGHSLFLKYISDLPNFKKRKLSKECMRMKLILPCLPLTCPGKGDEQWTEKLNLWPMAKTLSWVDWLSPKTTAEKQSANHIEIVRKTYQPKKAKNLVFLLVTIWPEKTWKKFLRS